MERVRSSRQNWCTDFIDGESYTTDFRSRVFRKKKKTPILCSHTRLPPLPPISMLLRNALAATAEIRADSVSRVYVNIEIGGSGGIHLVILVGN